MKKTVRALLVSTALFAVVISSPVASAWAEEAGTHIGIRPLGLGLNPDQYVFGFQSALGRFKIVRFAPSVDFGFGDNQTVTSFNLDVLLNLFSPPKVQVGFYVGAGLGLHMLSLDVADPQTGKDTETESEFGMNLVAGMKMPFGDKHYYNLESRFGVGISEVPDFRLLLGVMFGFGSAD